MVFCMELYKLQMDEGRRFAHEHPASAMSWAEPEVCKIAQMVGVRSAVGDQCQYEAADKDGDPIKKPTKFMTSSLEVCKALNHKCDGSCPRHVHPMEGRARDATIYPKKLCRTVLRSTMRQMKVDHGNLATLRCFGNQSEIMSVEFENDDWQRYRDDISGKELNGELVRAARAEEMAEFRKHGVYRKVPISECLRVTGKPPIGTRWIDINKGDEENPDYRSRLVAQELKRDKSLELFAATPPSRQFSYCSLER